MYGQEKFCPIPDISSAGMGEVISLLQKEQAGLPTNFLEVIIFRCSTFAFCVESGSLAGDPFSFFTAGFMANHLPFLSTVPSSMLLVARKTSAGAKLHVATDLWTVDR